MSVDNITDVYPYINVNGRLQEKESLSFPFLDYGFLYGYGAFDTILINQGHPVLLENHFKRLQRTSILLDIPCPYNFQTLETNIQELITKNNINHATLNIYLTPGNRPSTSTKTDFDTPLLLMLLRPVDTKNLHKPISIAVREESIQRIKMDRLKTMSYMKNIFEKNLHKQFDDVLLYNHNKEISETPTSNVFFIKDDILITPQNEYALSGITQNFIETHADKLGITCMRQPIHLTDLNKFDEIFLTNSLKGICFVKQVHDFPTLRSRDMTSKLYQNLVKLLNLRFN